MTTTQTTHGGCGGGCGAGTGCGCGGGQSGRSAYLRPRFFGGMLLTEDDLQAIDDYTVAKRRLTNRHMFGPGVVCGLDVDCDPCAPGWLTVTPGYALDCCGNDIVVGCPERVDALVLLDELRRRSPAGECADPCDGPSRDYLLVVRYDEQPTEPVAPYAQDDCAVGDCEPCRVREGYRFELVCEVDDPEPTLFDRLAKCLHLGEERTRDDVATLTQVVRMAGVAARVAAGETAAPAVPTAPEFDAAERDLAAQAGFTTLDRTLDLLGRSTQLLAADAAPAADGGPSLLTGRQRTLVERRRTQLVEALRYAPQLQALPAVDQDRIRRIVEVSGRDPAELAGLDVAERTWLTEGFDPVAAQASFTADAERIRGRVLSELDRSGRGNCREREEIAKLPLNRLDASSWPQVERLSRSYASVVAGCLCELANPPCPTCTQLEVPLARVRIENCRVVEVCALARQWVVAPRTIGYWLPLVEVLRRLLEKRCCPDRAEGRPPSTRDEVTALQEWGLGALTLLRSPGEAPELAGLYTVLADSAPPSSVSSTAPASAPAPAPGAPEADRLQQLEAQMAELSEQLRSLRNPGAGGSGGTP